MIRRFVAAAAFVVILSPFAALAAEKTVKLAVDNMSCESCPVIVKQSLASVDGVIQVTVSMEEKSAVVTYDDSKATIEALTAATTNAGYPSQLAD